MKKVLIFISLLLTFVNVTGQNQINVVKAYVRDWIIYKGDTLALTAVAHAAAWDTLFVTQGSILDTVIVSRVLELDNLSDVTLTTPDASDILILDDETMKWVNYPLSYLAGLLVDSADMDTSKWTRSGNHLYPKVIGDSVGIGTATPVERLDVQNGNINLDTTSATSGQITQNGIVLMHTYSDNVSEPNLFIGGGGNFTMDGNNNIGIGSYSLMGNTSGYNNNAIGYYSMSANATGIMNVAIGDYTLNNSSNGFYNVAVGYGSLNGNTSGTDNTAAGCGSMTQNTTGNANVSIGNASLSSNKTGNYNTAVGNYSLANNVGNTGSVAVGNNAMLYADDRVSGRTTYNTAVGYEAMRGSLTAANNTGQYNTAVGYQALDAMTSGSYNTAIGVNALGGLTSGEHNIGIGYLSLEKATTCYGNIGIGFSALNNITDNSGRFNVAIGYQSSVYTTSGEYNVANGFSSLHNNTTGDYNVAIGTYSMYGAIGKSQSNNVAIGYRSLYKSEDGVNNNVAIGYGSGHENASGSGNIFLGYQSGYNETGSNKLYIENSNADSAGALIFGNFATDELYINGSLDVDDTITSPWYRNQIITIPFGFTVTANLIDTTSFQFGTLVQNAVSVVNQRFRYFLYDGKIVGLNLVIISQSATSNEPLEFSITINGSSNYVIDTTGNSTTRKLFFNDSLDIDILQNDTYEFSILPPVMTTNPTSVIGIGEMYIKLD